MGNILNGCFCKRMSIGYILPSIKILLIEDDLFLAEVLNNHLLQKGICEFQSVTNIFDAKLFIPVFEPDILLLDVNLTDGSGIEFCRFLRQIGFVKPVIMIVENSNENDSIDSLNAGANDYITKPIRLSELFTRIKFQYEQHSSVEPEKFFIGLIEFIPENKTLSVRGKSKKIFLTEKETLILSVLFRSYPSPVHKDVLLKEVWGFQIGLSTHTLETHIYRLRHKIKELTQVTFILTKENGYGLV